MKENREVTDTDAGNIENSIEEDIKQVKDLMKELKEERGDIQISRIQHKLRLSINNILSDYKRVLKENEKLKNKLLDILEGQKVIKEETPQYIKENYIAKEKIKKELKELKEEYMNIQEIKKEKGDFGEEKSKIQTVLLYKIETLRDLLNWGEK